jgi:hypothetical protein
MVGHSELANPMMFQATGDCALAHLCVPVTNMVQMWYFGSCAAKCETQELLSRPLRLLCFEWERRMAVALHFVIRPVCQMRRIVGVVDVMIVLSVLVHGFSLGVVCQFW